MKNQDMRLQLVRYGIGEGARIAKIAIQCLISPWMFYLTIYSIQKEIILKIICYFFKSKYKKIISESFTLIGSF